MKTGTHARGMECSFACMRISVPRIATLVIAWPSSSDPSSSAPRSLTPVA